MTSHQVQLGSSLPRGAHSSSSSAATAASASTNPLAEKRAAALATQAMAREQAKATMGANQGAAKEAEERPAQARDEAMRLKDSANEGRVFEWKKRLLMTCPDLPCPNPPWHNNNDAQQQRHRRQARRRRCRRPLRPRPRPWRRNGGGGFCGQRQRQEENSPAAAR